MNNRERIAQLKEQTAKANKKARKRKRAVELWEVRRAEKARVQEEEARRLWMEAVARDDLRRAAEIEKEAKQPQRGDA